MAQVPTERQTALLNLFNTLGKRAIFHNAERRRMNRRHNSWFLPSGGRIAAGLQNILPASSGRVVRLAAHKDLLWPH
jgi:hypothetical protein